MQPSSEIFTQNLFKDLPLNPYCRYCIVIPVKNEEALILQTLNQFAIQEDLEGNSFEFESFEIIILANNCCDQSVPKIMDFKKRNPQIKVHLVETTLQQNLANIGFVRRTLMETAYQRLTKNGGGIILTTDGDTQVSKDWIAQNIFEIENGADAVGGRIYLLPDELSGLDESTAELHYKDEAYHLLAAELDARIIKSSYDETPKHHQHFNGSFAITTDCYKKSGGIPEVTHLEDCAFFERLELVDAKVRHSQNVIVYTSARFIGRTEVGLSYQLNEWKNLGSEIDAYFVESCESIVDRLRIKRKLMDLWEHRKNPDLNITAELKKIIPEFNFEKNLIESYWESEFFGVWYFQLKQNLENYWQEKYPPKPIADAIFKMENILKNYAS